MSKEVERKIGSLVYNRIQAARLSDRERQVAVQAMRNADIAVDAILWIVKKIEHLGERLFLKPSLKH